MTPQDLADRLMAAARVAVNTVQEITCPECGAKIQTGYETDPSTHETEGADRDNAGADDETMTTDKKEANLAAALLAAAKVTTERNKLDRQTLHALDAVKKHAKAAKRSAAEVLAAAIKAVKDQGKNNRM
jgi:hypothetical protein